MILGRKCAIVKEINAIKWLLIGIGNEYRNDDGVGLLIAREICKKNLTSVTVKEVSGEGAELIEAWQGFNNVIIVDAVSSGAKLGMIFKIDAINEIVQTKFFHYSSHAFSVAEAIKLAKEMKMLPPRLLLYGIEGSNFKAGLEISHTVQESAKQIIEQILNEIEINY